MESNKRILVFAVWFVPGYKAGGPIRSVFNLVKALSPFCDIDVVTSNTDFNETLPYPNIASDIWIEKDNFRVIYLSKKNERPFIKNLLQSSNYQSVYINSMYSLSFALYPLWLLKNKPNAPKIVLAPRGMLGQGSLKIKATKKKVFLTLSKLLQLFKNVHWHATNETEKKDILNIFTSANTPTVIKNIALPVDNEHIKSKIKVPHKVNLVYIGRISVIKNIIGAIRYLHNIDKINQVTFSVYGPMEEPEYWKLCKAEIAKLGSNVIVDYKGPVENHKIPMVLQDNHFLLMPSFHENYGHAIAESLLNLCPIIISDHTPWKNLSSHNIGWDIALEDVAGFTYAINTAAQMNELNYRMMQQACAQFANDVICDEKLNQEMLILLNGKA